MLMIIEKDYFDISLVDGFNLPMTIHVVTYDNSQPNPDEYWCNSPECLFDINSVCPPELSMYGPRYGLVLSKLVREKI